MDKIGTIATINGLPARSSQTESIANPIPVEKRRAMGDVFDRWRLNCGWNPWDDVTQAAAIASFVHSLDRDNVPHTAYSELYERVIELRVAALNNGKEIPRFGVEMMLACWPSLQKELRQREIAAGRTLTASAPSQCLRCYGTGMEAIFNDKGERIGVRGGCQHEHLDVSDPHMDGMARAEAAIHQRAQDDTALDICSRIRHELVYTAVRSIDQGEQNAAWAASRTWTHAERYVRENEGLSRSARAGT